jgi:hypothetical protein
MNGYVLYVEECTPKLRTFSNPKRLDKFVENFRVKKEDFEDSWIELIFVGLLTHADPALKLEKDNGKLNRKTKKSNRRS